MPLSAGPSLLCLADRFNIETIGVDHERSIIVRMIMWSEAGRAVVTAALRHRCCVKGVHSSAARGCERDMDAWSALTFRSGPPLVTGKPKERLSTGAISDAVIATRLSGCHFHHVRDAEWFERSVVKPT